MRGSSYPRIYLDGIQATAKRYQLHGRPQEALAYVLLSTKQENITAFAISALILSQAFYWVCRGIALIIKALKQ